MSTVMDKYCIETWFVSDKYVNNALCTDETRFGLLVSIEGLVVVDYTAAKMCTAWNELWYDEYLELEVQLDEPVTWWTGDSLLIRRLF